MKALVFHGDNDLRLQDVPAPVYGPDDVLVEVKAVGICGSDVQGFLGKTGRRIPPVIMGHEFAGIVIKTGANVRTYKPGDKVVVFPYRTCGGCPSCLAGRTNSCPNKTLFGVFTHNGAMAEFVAVPGDLLYPLPEGTDFTHGALAEPLSVAARCIEKTPIMEGSSVAVIGAGTIGLMCMILARQKGAKIIIAIDIDSERLAVARGLGADYTFNPGEGDVKLFLQEQHLEAGTDVVVEAVGIESTMRQAVEIVSAGGVVAVVGMSQRYITVDMHEIISKEIRTESSFLYDRRQFEYVLANLSELRPQLDKMISSTAPLEQGVEMYQRLAAGEPGLIKVVLIH